MVKRELRACARKGHVTYRPDDEALAARLTTTTALGEAWRCLRCGDYALGPPGSSGPSEDAPVPARGRALRQQLILRILAVERGVRGVVLLAAAYGVHRFSSAQQSLRSSLGDLIPAARPLAGRLGLDIDHSSLVNAARSAVNARHSTLTWIVVGLVAYGLLELVEGVGLWLARRWAEYLTVVATAAFLPLEIHELIRGVTVTRVGAFLLNVAAIVYLLLAKRLFGIRGGGARYEEELRGESLLELEAAAVRPAGDAGMRGRDVGMGAHSP